MKNLSILGGADPVGTPQNLQARNDAEDLEKDGLRFFADVKAKEAAEQYLQERKKNLSQSEVGGDAAAATAETVPEERIISDAEESIRNVILDDAVFGKHEALKFASDPVGVSRSWHLRAETYRQKDVEDFEKKLTSLIGPGAVAKDAKKAKSQQPKA